MVTYADRARRYAEQVVEGAIPAARPTRLACERHLLDLEKQADDDYPYRFDDDAGGKVCRFVEKMPHTKGRWADRGEKLILEKWQVFITCVVFGWLHKDTGLRRFRTVYIECPRKNGKSPYTAAVGLYMFAADDEFGAEVYSGAGSEKQAWEVFRPARLMAKNTPEFRQAFDVEVNAKNMNILADFSRFEPVIGKPGDGAAPSMAIHDEYHEHPDESQFETMQTGMVGREQPLQWVITTAGNDTSGPCYALRQEVMDVLDGSVTNDRLFGVIYTIDDEDDWTTEDALIKANPNYGVSIGVDELRGLQQDAVNYPRKQSTFKMKHLNVWSGAASPYFDLEKWLHLNDAPPLEDFDGEPFWGGLDLAQKIDLCAYVKLFHRLVEGESHYYAFLRAYAPSDTIAKAENRHFQGWAREGWLIETDGAVTDYDQIEDDVKDDAERFRCITLGADPHNLYPLGNHIMDYGVELVEVPQTVPHLSEPMKWVQALIEDGRIHHDGNPIFSWAIGNVTAQPDRNENVFPRKERAQNKIDPAVALIIAYGEIMGEVEEEVLVLDEPVVIG